MRTASWAQICSWGELNQNYEINSFVCPHNCIIIVKRRRSIWPWIPGRNTDDESRCATEMSSSPIVYCSEARTDSTMSRVCIDWLRVSGCRSFVRFRVASTWPPAGPPPQTCRARSSQPTIRRPASPLRRDNLPPRAIFDYQVVVCFPHRSMRSSVIYFRRRTSSDLENIVSVYTETWRQCWHEIVRIILPRDSHASTHTRLVLSCKPVLGGKIRKWFPAVCRSYKEKKTESRSSS